MRLNEKTRALLLSKLNGTDKEVSEATGLPRSWLSQYRHGHIKDPSVNRIQTLYEYLTGEQLLHG